MKKMDQLMAELGFNKNAPDSVKEAFIKHLIKASEGLNVVTPSEKKEMLENPERIVQFKMSIPVTAQAPQQMAFEFIETITPRPGKKAVSQEITAQIFGESSRLLSRNTPVFRLEMPRP